MQFPLFAAGAAATAVHCQPCVPGATRAWSLFLIMDASSSSNTSSSRLGLHVHRAATLCRERDIGLKHAESVYHYTDAVALVMGDSAKKKTIRFNSIRFSALSEPPRQSTPGVLDSDPEAAGPVHRSHERPARITTELLTAFAECEWRH